LHAFPFGHGLFKTKISIVIDSHCCQVGSRQLFKMKRTRESSVDEKKGERKWPRWEQWNPNKGDHIYCGEEPPAPWPGMLAEMGGTGSEELAPLVLPPGVRAEKQQEGQGLGASQGQDANTFLHMMDLHEGQIKHMEDGDSDSSLGDSDSTLPLPGAAASSSSTQEAAASSPSANVQSTDRYWDSNGSWSYWGGDWWQKQPGSTWWHKWKP
jgi:hypothetical protein